MDCVKTRGGIAITDICDLDLEQTLDCGQSFRWTKTEEGFRGVAFKSLVTMRIQDSRLYIDGARAEDFGLWKSYLDLDADYGAIRQKIAGMHPVLKKAAAYAPGIRILRQEPWEALCSFIISQNNNIKRIKGIVRRLCLCFGEDIGAEHAFPRAEAIAKLEPIDLAPIRAGFRDKYIIDGARKVSSGEVDLEKCRTLPLDEARAELMKIKGVGVKVADCVLLFGLHRLEAFPMDVWMKRAMEKLFPGMRGEDFGEYAGIAQQYIFHYSRMNPQIFL